MPVTITEVPSSATRNTGRSTWNANDTNLKNGVNALESSFDAHQSAGHPGVHPTVADFNAHKTSADHDGRYYTESEIDALIADIVKRTTDQTIDGIKTFLKNIIIKKAVPTVEFQNAAAEELAKLSADKDGSGNITVALQQWLAGAYKDIMKATNLGFVNFPRGAGMNDKRFATEEYVQARVKSGTSYGETIKLTTISDETVYSEQKIIPTGSKLIGLEIAGTFPGGDVYHERLNLEATYFQYNLWLQNYDGDCTLLVVRPELFAGEPFASRQLAAFTLTDTELPAGISFYIMPIISV